jgi:DNA-binding CsgD family transcriptional regulator
MTDKNADYSLFCDFFASLSRAGTEDIDPGDPLVVELDLLMEKKNQLFYIMDVILMDILYISKRVTPMFGLDPAKVSPGFFLTTTHPDDQKRHHLVRVKLISIAQELYIQKRGTKVISTNVKAKNPSGRDANLLYQCFLFYSKIPYESTFMILVITDISDFKNIHKGFHFYMGEDRSYFRYPDEKLLMSGNIFSNAEFSIIELIEKGLSSKEIAQKLFRSIHTITTHRSNIIIKSGLPNMTEVIRDLKAKGLL